MLFGQKNRLRRFNFTLSELLIVVVIITIIISILLPVINKTKLIAQSTCCLNNMKQISVVWNGYSDDFSDYYLPYSLNGYSTIYWIYDYNVFNLQFTDGASNSHPLNVAPPRFNKMFLCPSSKVHAGNYSGLSSRTLLLDYGYNRGFYWDAYPTGSNEGFTFVRQQKRSTPNSVIAKSVVFAESWKAPFIGTTTRYQQNNLRIVYDSSMTLHWLDIGEAAAHPSGAAQLFFDGHAAIQKFFWADTGRSLRGWLYVWSPLGNDFSNITQCK